MSPVGVTDSNPTGSGAPDPVVLRERNRTNRTTLSSVVSGS